MAEVIEVQIIADDSQIVGALNNIAEQADQLSGSMAGVSTGISEGLDAAPIEEASQGMGKLGKSAVKTTGSMRGFTRGGGRAMSAISRITGVGGPATQSLASMGAMMAGTPFGAFALAAAAATMAYSFFAGNNKEKTAEMVASNLTLQKSLNETTIGIIENNTRIKLQLLDKKGLKEQERQTQRIAIIRKQRLALDGDIIDARKDFRAKEKTETAVHLEEMTRALDKKDATESAGKKLKATTDKELAKKLWQDLTILSNNFYFEQVGDIEKLADLKKKDIQDRKDNEAAAAVLIASLIRDEVTIKIKALTDVSKAREADAVKLLKAGEQRNNFIKQNAKVLAEDIAKVRNEAAQAEQQAQKAFTAQLIIDDERRAIAEAENASLFRALELTATIKDKDELSAHIKQNELKLQYEIDAIIKQFADERKEKAITESDELMELKLAALEAMGLIEKANQEAKQEIARQTFAQIKHTDKEITDFKQAQADEILRTEINLQIERLKLIKDTNKQIIAEYKNLSDEEKAILAGQNDVMAAQIKALEARLKGVGVTIGKTVDKNKKEGKTLGDLLGMSSTAQKNSKAIQQAMEQVTAEIQKAVAARVAALQKEVDFRNKRVSEIQQDLANEIELNKLGKASNIKELQDQLKSEKAARDKAEAEKKKAAEAQFIVDTLMQTSNLVTSISALYASLSGLPFGIGIALATALSAVMIGAFIASKSQAASASGFAEGGYTGDAIGGKHERAGHVHRGEYVIDKETTERLGLQGASMSDFDGIMSSNYGGPNAQSMARKNKQINGHISARLKQRKSEMIQAYSDGVKRALIGQNSILKDILRATENTPVVFPLEGNRFLIQRGKNKTEIKRIKR